MWLHGASDCTRANRVQLATHKSIFSATHHAHLAVHSAAAADIQQLLDARLRACLPRTHQGNDCPEPELTMLPVSMRHGMDTASSHIMRLMTFCMTAHKHALGSPQYKRFTEPLSTLTPTPATTVDHAKQE